MARDDTICAQFWLQLRGRCGGRGAQHFRRVPLPRQHRRRAINFFLRLVHTRLRDATYIMDGHGTGLDSIRWIAAHRLCGEPVQRLENEMLRSREGLVCYLLYDR